MTKFFKTLDQKIKRIANGSDIIIADAKDADVGRFPDAEKDESPTVALSQHK